MRRSRQVRLARRGASAQVGTWPLFEARNKVLHWPAPVRGATPSATRCAASAPTVGVPPALVATVVPTYRRPESLARAVRSALDQTVARPRRRGRRRRRRDSRRCRTTTGWWPSRSRATPAAPGVVRNVGIALSSLDPPRLPRRRQRRGARTTSRPRSRPSTTGPDLVYTGVERVRPDGTTLDVLSRPFDAARAARVLLRRHQQHRRAPRPRRARSAGCRARGRHLPGEDWELVWRLSRRLRVRHVPETTVTYLVNPDSYFTRWDDAAPGPAAGVRR